MLILRLSDMNVCKNPRHEDFLSAGRFKKQRTELKRYGSVLVRDIKRRFKILFTNNLDYHYDDLYC